MGSRNVAADGGQQEHSQPRRQLGRLLQNPYTFNFYKSSPYDVRTQKYSRLTRSLTIKRIGFSPRYGLKKIKNVYPGKHAKGPLEQLC